MLPVRVRQRAGFPERFDRQARLARPIRPAPYSQPRDRSVAWFRGTAAVSLGDRAFVALVIFKEAQAFAARSVRKLVSRARAFLDLPPEQPPKPKHKGPRDSV